MLYMAWRHAGRCPYRLYNVLDERYRPLGHPDEDSLPPPFPARVQAFEYGCALVAAEENKKG